ncbi:hypothetical protein WH95_13060 [Kiloniella litopenaei]|uniref:Uncharacterized protein n=1 Tax=Kiloniella litopenaei TaxID=1549748 RepID=A0A0M2R7M1_9PROT|nr:DUF6463 family protein [Kiloniella litopenaei]KKJ76409.1 hypothetical protein WH95_13060 [Kiloniella litopenaei]
MMPITMRGEKGLFHEKISEEKLFLKRYWKKLQAYFIEQRWVGRWIMGVAITHVAFTFVLFPSQIAFIFMDGFFDTGIANYEISNTVWFFFFGVPLFLVGHLIDRDEKGKKIPPFQEVLLFTLVGMTALGIMLIPVSGFWLMIPAIFGFYLKNKSANDKWN